MIRQSFYESLAFYGVVLLSLTACVTATDADKSYIHGYDQRTSAQIYLDIGLLRLTQQNTAEAEHYLLKAYKLDKNRLETLETLALLYQFKQHYKESATWLQKALELDNTHGRLHYNYGVLLFQQQDYRQAIEAFTMAISDQKYHNKIKAWQNIARCYQELHDLKAAQMIFDKVEQLSHSSIAN